MQLVLFAQNLESESIDTWKKVWFRHSEFVPDVPTAKLTRRRWFSCIYFSYVAASPVAEAGTPVTEFTSERLPSSCTLNPVIELPLCEYRNRLLAAKARSIAGTVT